jgi:hypothetical protein
VILAVLFDRSSAESERHHQEEKPRYFQPEHVGGASKGAPCGSSRLQQRICRTAPARLVASNPRHNTQFSESGNFAHSSILPASRRYNDAGRLR